MNFALLEKAMAVPFSTPMIDRVLKWAGGLIEDGHCGGVIYAPPRTGKTFAIRVMCRALAAFASSFGHKIKSATIAVTARDRTRVSEGAFWDWLLHEFRSPAVGRASVAIRRHRVYQHFADVALRSESGRVLLFVDEAQFIDSVEYGWFADIFNELRSRDLEYVMFQFGHDRLRDWQLDLDDGKHLHVLERFFSADTELHGLRQLVEFERCMTRYDNARVTSDHPETYMQAFQPDWYREGGRLADCARVMFDAFAASRGSEQLEVPMKHFVAAVRLILLHGPSALGPKHLNKIIERTGFPGYVSRRSKSGKGSS